MTQLDDTLVPPQAAPGTGEIPLGQPASRIDGPAKVTGTAQFAAEHGAPDLCVGVIVNATIAKGRITSIDATATLAVAGALGVISHLNRPHVRSWRLFYKDMIAPGGKPFRPLHDDRIAFSGQPVALVVAETFEAARYAASLLDVRYEREPHETKLAANRDCAHTPSRFKAGYAPPPDEKGDAKRAFADASVKVDVSFDTHIEHHHPMEPFATTVIRSSDGHLTIYDKTQSSQNSRWYVSRVFGLSRSRVTVRNPFVGGAFGAALRPQYQLPLAVMAALQLERSVRVAMTREQMVTIGHRPATIQHVRLAATETGQLLSIQHDAVAETSQHEDYVENVVNWSGQLYGCENIKLGYELVSLDHYSPIEMRAPGGAQGVFALEVAMDELSYELQKDPLALRLQNYAEVDPISGLPYSSKELRACYAQGAEKFGWSRRPQAPRSMRDRHEWTGWGMATGIWDALQMFARAKAELRADGQLVVSSAATDIGTGTYTVMTQIAADTFGLPLERVTFHMGDSTLPTAPVQGGSSHVATVGSAIAGACEKLQKALHTLAGKNDKAFKSASFESVEFAEGTIRLRSQPATSWSLADLLAASKESSVSVKYLLLPNVLKQRKFSRAAHSAVFCEVKVDELLGTVRVTRVVSAIAAGQIMNPKAATSQITGGVVWGISQALFEETQCDHRLGRFMTRSLADYHVASNRDTPDIDVIFVDEDDRIVSQLGAKGVGEIGLVGVAAAVCNAIYHATGKRVRQLPMTPDIVMAD